MTHLQAPLPSRAQSAADALLDQPHRFVVAPMSEGGCACSPDHDERPTEQPVGHASFLLDEDGERFLVGVWNSPDEAREGIARHCVEHGVERFEVADSAGSPFDAFLGELDCSDLPAVPDDRTHEEAARDAADLLAELAAEEAEDARLREEDPAAWEALRELRDAEQDAFLRDLRRAA